jgi:hypothetical protein
MSPLVAELTSSGTSALAQRSGSSVQLSGRYSCHLTGKLACSHASDTLTATWQLSCLPSIPHHWRATPTECWPFLGKPVSSTSQ